MSIDDPYASIPNPTSRHMMYNIAESNVSNGSALSKKFKKSTKFLTFLEIQKREKPMKTYSSIIAIRQVQNRLKDTIDVVMRQQFNSHAFLT